MELIEEKYGLEKFLLRLQKECGGHGEGIALSKDNKVFYMRKGVKYKITTIAKQLRTMDWEWCVYHTRVKSVGEISDKNCHPFKSGNIVLAMNGTESGYKGLADALNITDTQAVLLSIRRFNLDLYETLKPLSSNFIGFNDGVPFATSPNNYKSYDIARNEIGAIVIASSLPEEFEIHEPIGKPFVWTANDELKTKKKEKITYSKSWFSAEDYEPSKAIVTWQNKIKPYDYNKYYCGECGEISRGDELFEDLGAKYCPFCGEELGFKDKIQESWLVD
jgi:hypothetical protein